MGCNDAREAANLISGVQTSGFTGEDPLHLHPLKNFFDLLLLAGGYRSVPTSKDEGLRAFMYLRSHVYMKMYRNVMTTGRFTTMKSW